MLCYSQSGNNWFRACAQGDISLVERLKTRKKGVYDSRPSSGNGLVFKGFVGLHYASYFDRIDVVRSLLDLEYDKLTQYSILVYPHTNSTPIELDTLHEAPKAGISLEQQIKNRPRRHGSSRSYHSSTSHTELFNTNVGTWGPQTCATPSVFSMTRICSDYFEFNVSPTMQSSSTTQPFTLDKGSSALMIAIARRNFKLAKYIIDWLKDRRQDIKKLNSMLKLQNASSMSALMLLCTMRASTAAAAILQSGDLMLLHHEFVLLSKEGKSCLHYCIDSGSYIILETIFWVMCDKHAETEEGYMLKYRLAQMLLYDKSIPKPKLKPGQLTRIPSSNVFSNRDDASSAESSSEDQFSDNQVIDLGNVCNAYYPSTDEFIDDHQRMLTNTESSKQQTLLDYVLYQTSSLSAETRSRIYALVYYYSKKVYIWAMRDYINICKEYSNMTPDIAFLQHVKRWANFEQRYPKPQTPYFPASKDDRTDISSFTPSSWQSENLQTTHISPMLPTSTSMRSVSNSRYHRRCISLNSIVMDFQSPNNATSTGTLSPSNQVGSNYTRNSLVKSLDGDQGQGDSVTFHIPIGDNDRELKPELQESGFIKRKGSVQHLLEDDHTSSQETSSSISIEGVIDAEFDGMNTARRITLTKDDEVDDKNDDAAPNASRHTRKASEDFKGKSAITSITLPATTLSDSLILEPSSARSPRSVQHNAFRQPREPLEPAPSEAKPGSSLNDSCMCSRSASASDFNTSSRSIIRFNDNASFGKESDSEQNSVVNIAHTSNSE